MQLASTLCHLHGAVVITPNFFQKWRICTGWRDFASVTVYLIRLGRQNPANQPVCTGRHTHLHSLLKEVRSGLLVEESGETLQSLIPIPNPKILRGNDYIFLRHTEVR